MSALPLAAARPPSSGRDGFLAAARQIGDEILERRVRTRLGNRTWLTPSGYGTDLHPLRTAKAGADLYDGVGGIALFLAALNRAGGEARFRAAALEALAPLRSLFATLADKAEPERGPPFSIGAFLGAGSWIYALLRIGDLLGEPELAAEAHALSALFTRETIERDRRVRVQTGAAGAILALLALHRRSPRPNRRGDPPLELAKACGRHLAATRTSFGGLPAAWPLSPGKPPLIGFSYGAAGVAYALTRLDRLEPNPEFAAAAGDGLRFVEHFHCPDRGGWRDVRAAFESSHRLTAGTWKDWWASGTPEQLVPAPAEPPGGERQLYPTLWCHGAPGIALGRLAALDWEDGPAIRREIAGALDFLARRIATDDREGVAPDDLCCGRAGQVEVFLEASRRLGESRWRELAEELAGGLVRRAAERGRYLVSAARGTEVFAPNLFQGIAGVGYTLLRLADPDVLPCLLLLE
jgi:lantibiotic modifying enzyme